MIAVEVENRSGAAVDEDAASSSPARVLARRGHRRRRARDRVRRARRDPRAQARAPRHRRTDRRALVPDRRPRRRCPTGVPRALGDVVLCPQVVGEEWRGPLVHGLLHLLGYDHGDEMEAREQALPEHQLAAPADAPRLVQLRLRGGHPRAAHAAEHADPLPHRGGRARAALWRRRRQLELIALLLSITFVLIAEMINTAIEGAIDVATTSFDPMAKLAKDVAAGAVLIATVNAVAVGYLVFSADRQPLVAPARPAARRARRADDRRARADRDRRDRGQGADRPRHAAARRPPSGHAASRSPAGCATTSSARHAPFLVSTLAFMMALLVAQTRVESGIHSTLEVVLGGLSARSSPLRSSSRA